MTRGAGWLGASLVLGLWGCAGEKPDLDGGGQDGADDSPSSSDDAVPDDGGDDDPSMTSASESSAGDEDPSDDEDPTDGDSTGCSFIGCDETGGCDGGQCECDVWAQDCQEGEKCNPWANDGGNSWNATKCVPLADSPAQPGDPCEAEGGGISGFDNCDASSMCWNVDETGAGVCVAFCSGSEAAPVCEDVDATCVIANDGVLILCLPSCDPLMSDCGEGQACYPADESFACVFDASADAGAFGDPCEFTNVCDPGLWCAPAAGVPDCATASCCTSFCDQSDPEADASCPGAAGGQECVPWYDENQIPPGFEDVGACLIPG